PRSTAARRGPWRRSGGRWPGCAGWSSPAAGARRSAPPSGRRPTSTTSGGRSWRPPRSGRSRRGAADRARAGSRRRGPSGGHQRLELALQALDQVGERLLELLDALLLEHLHDVVVGDAGLLEGAEDGARAVEVLEDRVAADLAVVVGGVDRLQRH